MEEWSDQLLPEGFRKRMLRLLGKEAEDAFLASYSAAPLRRGLRVNTLKCGIHRLRELFSLPLEPLPFSTAGFFLPTEHRAGADPLHHAGAYYMQEPSAMSAVTVLAPRPGERVLDLCAAPGGKSIQRGGDLGGFSAGGSAQVQDPLSGRGPIPSTTRAPIICRRRRPCRR